MGEHVQDFWDTYWEKIWTVRNPFIEAQAEEEVNFEPGEEAERKKT